MTQNRINSENINTALESFVDASSENLGIIDSSPNEINLVQSAASSDSLCVDWHEEKEILAEKRYYDAICDLIEVDENAS